MSLRTLFPRSTSRRRTRRGTSLERALDRAVTPASRDELLYLRATQR